MRTYFLNITEEDKENILDKHKSVYDGYATKSNEVKEQPLYVQDFANDKEGVTVNSKGEVSKYNNKIYMKESKSICSECGLYEDVCECNYGNMEEDECNECGDKGMEFEEGIYDVAKPWGKGVQKFDYVEDECEECNMTEEEDEEEFDSELLYTEELTDKAHNQLVESLNMFNRFKKYN